MAPRRGVSVDEPHPANARAAATANKEMRRSDLDLLDRAPELYELLAPFSNQIASGGSILYGSIAWAPGRLATTLGCYEQAEEHFAAAAHIDERLGAPLFLARTRACWAAALIARGRTDDLDRVQPMLEKAEGAARRPGADGIIREVAGVQSRPRGDGHPSASSQPLREGRSLSRAASTRSKSRSPIRRVGALQQARVSRRP
jgi:hypothetical protein